MSRALLRRLRLPKTSQLASANIVRSLHVSPRYQTAVALNPSFEEAEPTSSTQDLRKTLLDQKLRGLDFVVRQESPSPTRVWGHYMDMLNFVGPEKVPLEIHQLVLRKCTPSPDEARLTQTRRLEARSKERFAHKHEARFQSIVHNIREAGFVPSIEDYHFILEHFAAVGHHMGVFHVMQEIAHLGLEKTPKTYGLCLQALAHRLTLPTWHRNRPTLVTDINKIFHKLLNEMGSLQVPVTPINLDFALRILRETLDLEGFERLMKVAYGIDLAYPDRPPLEFWNANSAEEALVNGTDFRLPTPQPFSTAALNTTVDFLGSLENVSKVVQAFEVLTSPIPSSSTSAPASSFEDDEDEDFGQSNPGVAPYAAPHAKPNTTTYSMLLKWISRANHHIFARHYLLEVMHLDRIEDRRLRGDCMRYSQGEILAPHLAVNRNHLQSVFSLANRSKNVELLRWVLVKTNRVLRRKRADIRYYSAVEERWRSESGSKESADAPEPASVSTSSEGSTPVAESSWTSQSPPKLFDISRHLSILRRDEELIEEFEKRVVDVVGRNTQRVKERLGRRVWSGKDVYMRHQGTRTNVPRDVWRKTVRFRAVREQREGYVPLPSGIQGSTSPGHIAARRGFFTPSSPYPAQRAAATLSSANIQS